jgi:hypothetical protein
VHGAAYGGNSLLGRSDTHRVDAGIGLQNERDPIARQCKLESLEENKVD